MIKIFTDDMPNAPVLSGSAGAVVALLSACLVDGWGVKTATSATVTDEVATLTFGSAHEFLLARRPVLLVAGNASIAGERGVTGGTPTTLTFPAPGVADGTLSGTITAKMAAAGWSKPFSATGKAAFKSVAPDTSGGWLRVDDTNTVSGWSNDTAHVYATEVRMLESMTALDSYVGTHGGWWHKSNANDSAARHWTVIADDRSVYFFPETWNDGVAGCYFFGDFVSTRPGDGYNCAFGGAREPAGVPNYFPSQAPGSSGRLYSMAQSQWKAILRPHTQASGAVVAFTTTWSLIPVSGRQTGSFTSLPSPNPEDGGIFAVQSPHLIEGGNTLRGVLPGFYQMLQVRPFPNRQRVLGSGREFVAMIAAADDAAGDTVPATGDALAVAGQALFDMTGPWR